MAIPPSRVVDKRRGNWQDFTLHCRSGDSCRGFASIAESDIVLGEFVADGSVALCSLESDSGGVYVSRSVFLVNSPLCSGCLCHGLVSTQSSTAHCVVGRGSILFGRTIVHPHSDVEHQNQPGTLQIGPNRYLEALTHVPGNSPI